MRFAGSAFGIVMVGPFPEVVALVSRSASFRILSFVYEVRPFSDGGIARGVRRKRN